MNADVAMWLAFGAACLSVGGIVFALFAGPIGRALGSRLQRRPPNAIPPELMDQLQDLPDLLHRVEELEERLDFAERLLAAAKDTEVRIPRDAE